MLSNPIFVNDPKTEYADAQRTEKTVTFTQAGWDIFESQSDIMTVTPSIPAEDISAPNDWWSAKSAESSTVAFMLVENIDKLSKFLIDANSNEDIIYSSSYQLAPNDTGDSGRTESQAPKESRFVKWMDSKEKAATTFIPEGWSADLQIIRPYKSMTGFVFFARGDENTLVYVFQPFMPLYILPSRSLCETDSICFSSIISAEKVREMSLGNAPIAVSNFKTPEQYFTSEVLPILTRNLNAYTVDSAESVYAPIYGDGNSTDIVPAYDVDYNFNVENKKISGKAMVFTRNYTTNETGIWNGFIVGVESSENNFDRALHQAAVTLLNLQFEEQWLNSERTILLQNANTSQALSTIPELMANSTLDDFYLIVPTAANYLVTSQNNTMVTDYLDKDNDKELHLPLFPELQYWYLNGDQLVGQDLRRD
ncbi:MAG TPA: hypothetical protein VN239_01795 [Nitrososphaera sp.]|nr:hypothetical protein [Nitrososphaera sp.]